MPGRARESSDHRALNRALSRAQRAAAWQEWRALPGQVGADFPVITVKRVAIITYSP
jgi:hypothetical protein